MKTGWTSSNRISYEKKTQMRNERKNAKLWNLRIIEEEEKQQRAKLAKQLEELKRKYIIKKTA